MSKKIILILGADGFIGSNLLKVLAKDNNYIIRAFDLFRRGEFRET